MYFYSFWLWNNGLLSNFNPSAPHCILPPPKSVNIWTLWMVGLIADYKIASKLSWELEGDSCRKNFKNFFFQKLMFGNGFTIPVQLLPEWKEEKKYVKSSSILTLYYNAHANSEKVTVQLASGTIATWQLRYVPEKRPKHHQNTEWVVVVHCTMPVAET